MVDSTTPVPVCTRPAAQGRTRAFTFAWVNRLTAAEYLQAFTEIGFRVRYLRRSVTDIDAAFYKRFEDKLGRYPALDLETDFLHVVVDKVAEVTEPPPVLVASRKIRGAGGCPGLAGVAAGAAVWARAGPAARTRAARVVRNRIEVSGGVVQRMVNRASMISQSADPAPILPF